MAELLQVGPGLARGLDTPDAVQLISYLTSTPESRSVFSELLSKAKFFFGIQRGNGLAMAKLPSGQWSAPAFFNWGAGEAGPTLGLSHIYSVIVLNTGEALKQFTTSGPKFKFGAGLEVDYLASKSIGQAKGGRPRLVMWILRMLVQPGSFLQCSCTEVKLRNATADLHNMSGRDAHDVHKALMMATDGPKDALVFNLSKGLLIDFTLSAGFVSQDISMNEQMYPDVEPATAENVMKEGVPRPKMAEPLFRALLGVDSDVGHLEATSPRSTATAAHANTNGAHANTNGVDTVGTTSKKV
eukprot:jgi/Astpho2/8071/Aster-03019